MLRIIILFAAFTTAALAAVNPARDLATEHALFGRFEGPWTELLEFKSTPDAEPIKLSGSNQFKVVLGGRFLEARSRAFSGHIMHEGISMFGFEPENERFSCVWFDNQDNVFRSIYGQLNTATQMLEFKGPATGKNDGCTYEFIHSLPRNDRYRWSFRQVHPDGTEGWSMRAVGSRMVK